MSFLAQETIFLVVEVEQSLWTRLARTHPCLFHLDLKPLQVSFFVLVRPYSEWV